MGNSQSNLGKALDLRVSQTTHSLFTPAVKKSPKKQKNEIPRNDHATNLTHGSITMVESAALSMTVEDNDPSSKSPVAGKVRL